MVLLDYQPFVIAFYTQCSPKSPSHRAINSISNMSTGNLLKCLYI